MIRFSVSRPKKQRKNPSFLLMCTFYFLHCICIHTLPFSIQREEMVGIGDICSSVRHFTIKSFHNQIICIKIEIKGEQKFEKQYITLSQQIHSYSRVRAMHLHICIKYTYIQQTSDMKLQETSARADGISRYINCSGHVA